MNQSKAIIIVENREALRVAASAARISTQQGTAMEMFEGSRGDERDLKLIGKVLSSGHKSVIEHQTFSVAFNDVSVLVEQFVTTGPFFPLWKRSSAQRATVHSSPM